MYVCWLGRLNYLSSLLDVGVNGVASQKTNFFERMYSVICSLILAIREARLRYTKEGPSFNGVWVVFGQ